MKVYVNLAEGFEEMEAISVIDLLRRAGADVITVKIPVGAENEQCKSVTGAHGVPIKADVLLGDANYGDGDMIVLPGGMPGTKNLGDSQQLMQKLQDYYKAGKWVAAICAAPMVLAKEGILTGKKATIYPGMEEFLEGAEHCGDAVVKDGKVITGRGPGVAVDFALALIEVLFGAAKMQEIKKDLTL